MSRIHLICGKICSGKSTYARQLKAASPAVILSTDEATFDLIQNEQGEFYDIFAARVNAYLARKAIEIAQAGADVILDWGFWTREGRSAISRQLSDAGVSYTWHYIDIDDAQWHRQIAERNERVASGLGGSDFYVDEGLLNKLLSMFQPPEPNEMDVWYRP